MKACLEAQVEAFRATIIDYPEAEAWASPCSHGNICNQQHKMLNQNRVKTLIDQEEEKLSLE